MHSKRYYYPDEYTVIISGARESGEWNTYLKDKKQDSGKWKLLSNELYVSKDNAEDPTKYMRNTNDEDNRNFNDFVAEIDLLEL